MANRSGLAFYGIESAGKAGVLIRANRTNQIVADGKGKTVTKNAQFSIWLMPEARAGHDLQRIVEQIASGQNGPSFMPHVTLLGDLCAPFEVIEGLCADASGSIGEVQADVLGMQTSDRFFMAAFLPVTVPRSIWTLRQTLAKSLGVHTADPWVPHLSLAYGTPPDEKTLRAISPQIPRQIAFDRVGVVFSSKFVPIENWHVRTCCAL